MENRIKELRKSHNMSQEALGSVIHTSQHAVSKMELNSCAISVDLLIKMAQYYNVTTNYILGLSETKRDLISQLRCFLSVYIQQRSSSGSLKGCGLF